MLCSCVPCVCVWVCTISMWALICTCMCVCTCACVHTRVCVGSSEVCLAWSTSCRSSPNSLPPPLSAQDCCSCSRDGTVIQTGRSQVWNAAVPQLPGSNCCKATAETYLPEAGIMFQCCDRQAMLVLEMGILVTVLLAGSAGQNSDRREAGSSCYGGFDLYFVLDK